MSLESLPQGRTMLGFGIALSGMSLAYPGAAQAADLPTVTLAGQDLPVVESLPIYISTRAIDNPGMIHTRVSPDKAYYLQSLLPSRTFIASISAPTTTPITDQYARDLPEWSQRVRDCMRAKPKLYRIAVVEEAKTGQTMRVAVPVVIDEGQGDIQLRKEDGQAICPMR